jgi:hypothetical protein
MKQVKKNILTSKEAAAAAAAADLGKAACSGRTAGHRKTLETDKIFI